MMVLMDCDIPDGVQDFVSCALLDLPLKKGDLSSLMGGAYEI